MDLLQGRVGQIYFKYLSAAFGSALIGAIYSIVDMAVVGQYQGPEGTAALAVVAPVWNIIYSLGLLMGIGGSVLLATAKGRGERRTQNEFFTAALLGTVVLAAGTWVLVGCFETPLLRLFGAEDALLDLAKRYLQPIQFVVPLFLFNQMLSSFLRNDNAPGLATAAVLSGGIFNIFGDYFFVFTLDMGIYGAGLATAMGAVITFLLLLSHFFTRNNTLRLVRPTRLLAQLGQVVATGMSSFVVDVAMGVLTTLFNRQIITYLGTDALAVYGILVNISTVVQCCAYSVGHAAQPLLSVNYGARQWSRIRTTLSCSLVAAAVFSLAWTALICLFPNGFVRIFMNPTAQIYAIAPFILRSYGSSFLFMPFNVFSTFYFQSLMKPTASFAISVTRGLVISGGLILLLPGLAGAEALWFAMPITEVVVAVLAGTWMVRVTRRLATDQPAHQA